MAATVIYRTDRSWIQKTPGVCGGDPCIRNTRITVHGLVEYKKLGVSDQELLNNIIGLKREDLEAAWAYYEEHTRQIDHIIRAEAEA